MNKYFKIFIHRGAIFGGFGPIIMAIVYLILHLTIDGFSVDGSEIFSAIISTYIIAFIHAGSSIFAQIEHWPIAKSILVHFALLYFTYTLCYLINSWIPFDIKFLLVFTACFLALYFIIWLTVYFAVKATQKRLNARLK